MRNVVLFFLLSCAATWATAYGIRITGLVGPGDYGMLALACLALLFAVPAIIACALGGMPRDEKSAPAWKPEHKGSIVIAVLGTLLVFTAAHTISALMGWGNFDWSVSELTHRLPSQEELNLPVPVPSTFILVAGVVISLLLGATLYTAISAPCEYAWRGYLLRNLHAWGHVRASLCTALLWAVWAMPVAYLWMPEESRAVRMLGSVALLILGLGLLLGALSLRYNTFWVAAGGLGGFLGQCQGVWSALVPHPIEPWGGMAGYVAAALWLALGVGGLLMPGWTAVQTSGQKE